MNKCLLGKWIYKIKRGDNDLCTNLLRKKYLGERGFYNSSPDGFNFGKVYMTSKKKWVKDLNTLWGMVKR